jgi:Spy/CpxP family protein refolding chaperone
MNKGAFAAVAGGILAMNLALGQQPQVNPAPSPQPGPPAGNGPGPGMMEHQGRTGNGGMIGGGMMGGFGWRNIPDLTPDQRSKIEAIRRDLRNRQSALMDQMHDRIHSTPYYRNGQFDEQAARLSYDETEKLRRQMFENALDAHKRVDALLTAAQRQQLARKYGGS